MNAADDVDWARCTEVHCTGEQIAPYGRCLAHLTNDELCSQLARIADGSAGISASGTRITTELWLELRRAAPTDAQARPVLSNANFTCASFTDIAEFNNVVFDGPALFDGAAFHNRADFSGATFKSDVSFDKSTVTGLADFTSTVFEGRAHLTALDWEGGARFESARFAQPSAVTGREDQRSPLRILSFRRAEVGALLLGNVDLGACRFDGARNLDQLRLGAQVKFAEPPKTKRWSRRRVLAEECMWRAAQPAWRGDSKRWQPKVQAGGDEPSPRVVMQLYREFRKGREDQRAEPAAADFYYGEMEMRRRDKESTWSERAIISAYWALSGYALRSSRVFAWLGVVLIAFAVLFHSFGFEHDQSWGRAILVSFTGTAFRQTENISLSLEGEVLSAVLRIIGPLLLALALLSIRGRVKR